MRKPKKLINDPMAVAQEQYEGMLAAMSGKLEGLPGITAAIRTDLPSDKVAIVTGGGSGHEHCLQAMLVKAWQMRPL
ncbi:putative dihydroxyacetone kinase [Vibrio ishigakensis]|uniref:Putative dihydroxyacetone kinase n=1 Tax=Vibrio ishigakensis TaxID=1481914 RepID=A0A0B8Q8M0_9VIBR|nr:putative dihydroxyacetone kinase [Vibrio ishigakensis]